jgi:KUP system potassium uptake protein
MAAQPAKKSMTFLALAALGVVFGDIGTSPLYSFQTALWSVSKPDQSSVLGIASLIIWCLLLLVTLKYVFVVMRADYHGEGGVFALLALLQERLGRAAGLKLPFHTLLLLFGAALLFGDGTITPAISVLSAMEGLESVNPKLMLFVVPGTVGILGSLHYPAIWHRPAWGHIRLGDVSMVRGPWHDGVGVDRAKPLGT